MEWGTSADVDVKTTESTLKCVILIVKNNRARGINSITYEVRERDDLLGVFWGLQDLGGFKTV